MNPLPPPRPASGPRASATTPLLEMRGITKRFGSLIANDAIDFDLRAGEIHALLGENGAGKSTLMSILFGMVSADAGEVHQGGEPITIETPEQAISRGIGMVHQHFMLVPVMTVAENVVLAAEPRRGPVLDGRTAVELVGALAERHGFALDPKAKVEDLSVGEQQRVEILRILYRGARVMIFDEPTAVLTTDETVQLFTALESLRASGSAIVLISHKLPDVLRVSDRVTVLRRGKKVGTVDTAEATERGLARMMVGRDVVFEVEKEPARPQPSPLLEVRDLRVSDRRGLPAVRGVSLAVHPGEIVALAGVDGNGQRELVEALTGLRQADSGSVTVGGRDLTRASARAVTEAGVGYITEDRHRRGLILDFSIADNLILRDTRSPGVARRGWLRGGRAERAARAIEEFDVRAGTPELPVRALSGGNQQKVVIARELSRDPSLLIAAQPTRGLDVGAIESVHRRLVAERDAGRAILLVSLELDEVRALADRILVICAGEIAAELAPEASEDVIGMAMSGMVEAV